ncbi:hypothetical protein AJ78_07709 [Emergomyces pasteurianus Ep9510]|uniref:Uncharacterized protein n=1 Tax=Emergomyces pasteurianus Ep9510 TaxID=1447872 RepID=A0A1J9P574_9EURO|nr:hypothetical protein AJ78_07709 [Emergomyces pasteurianus Ep9510]
MADNTAVTTGSNGTAANSGSAAGPQAAPDDTGAQDNAAAAAGAVRVPGDTSTLATPMSGSETANEVDNRHGRYWRFCKKCRHVRPTRWSYWEDKRNPPTSRHFWYFVSFAWRYLSASRCPECKCKVVDPGAPPREDTPAQTQGPNQEQAQEQDILQPE